VLVGGLDPFARIYPRAVVLLLVLVPPSAALAAVLSNERRPGRVALFVGVALAGLLVLLGLGGLLAFSSTKPWILPAWTWVLCGTALLLCWLALSRIRDSEGALSGQVLAQWGLRLSLFFGAIYAVYLAGNVFAVRSQAAAAGKEFLDLIRDGELDQAFLRMIKPGARPVGKGADLREALEVQHNAARGPQLGAYSAFRLADYVQFIRMSGPKASFKLASASSEYRPEGFYWVHLTYDVQTVVGSFKLAFLVQSVDLPAEGRREWFINPNRPIQIEDKKALPEGLDMENTIAYATPLVLNWIAAMQAGDTARAYLDTLADDQRKAQERAWLLGSGVVPLAPAMVHNTPDLAAFRKGLKAYTEARLLDLKDVFWAAKNSRKEVLDKVKALFAGKGGDLIQLRPMPGAGPPVFERLEGDRARIRFTAQIGILVIPSAPARYLVESQIEVEGPYATGGVRPTGEYRVTGLRLVRSGSGPAERVMQGAR
jgi:hypothetical protein